MKFSLPVKKPEARFWLLALLQVVITGIACFVVWRWPDKAGLVPGSLKHSRWLTGLGVATVASLGFAVIMFFSARDAARQSFKQARTDTQGDDLPPSTEKNADTRQPEFHRLKSHLHRRYGFFWRYKVRLLMVVGEQSQIAAVAPGLADRQWLEGSRTVLLHGGSLNDEVNKERLTALRKLRRSRPLDGIVWAVSDDQSSSSHTLDNGLRTLEQTGDALRYQPPVYLWQVCHSRWLQDERITQPVGVILPARATAEDIGRQLRSLLPKLRGQGLAQVMQNRAHDFLLRFGQSLEKEGITHWQQRLAPWLADYSRIPLRGLMFSLPVPQTATGIHEHRRDAPAVWQGVTGDCATARGRRVGMARERTLCHVLLACIALWGAGCIISFAVNRQQIVSAAEQAQQLVRHPAVTDAQLIALQSLRNDIGLLQVREQDGAPWYQRFGLSHHAQLLAALMPWYARANNRIIRDAAAQGLHAGLSKLANLPPASPLRAQMAKPGYDQLKAYLMMVRPEKADAAFYAQTMKNVEPTRPGISASLWQSIAPDLWRFYAANLAARPDWKITPDNALISEARQVLLEQIGQRNAESTLYENMLTSVRRNYADLRLEEMTGDTDAGHLFTTGEVVPGMFTRQAWDGGIQDAIDKAVNSRRDEIDWVLSDNRKSVAADISPEALKKRLTERYFTDFAGAWLNFLNSLNWNDAQSLSDVTDQLTLMSDVRQSPLIALMNTLAFQGQAGRQDEGLSDSLVKSARDLLGKKDQPVIDQQAAGPVGPLDDTFGPLLTLMGKNRAQNVMSADSSLSLQTYLTRVTRVRLKLQQVSTAPDPQAMMQQLAQTVFQGKSVDLTDTREYGSLVAASLGEEWNSFGQTLFVRPLARAWERVLQPSAASLNDQWKNAVVANWHSAFDGRYPVAASKSDISMPMLAEFIRRDSGRIERFLTTELNGVLHKEGSRWVADKTNSQGLTFNPAFLKAINQLSQLSDILFTDGSQGISFELQARPVPDVVETQLSVDGQKLHYFNQMADWQSFRWPGETYKPGAMLTWTSTSAGARLFGDYTGSWGFIRLLEQAKTVRLDDGVYQLTLTAPDNRQLQWILRTQLGDGPLALLKLRNFVLPAQIFSVDASATEQMLSGDTAMDDNSDTPGE
ncbi:ImcF-related family protein [Atlantibacter hermannii]|uniref:ImcF-related family protein n=1 Tax=Atlantibacter hermannii TaxID=565 RepID=UPI0022B788B0|nr:ImcF-related family protein [Atlantibacter hermannii]MCZ7837047.1 type VI secretion protein VasK [Atlantibacter hermannii]